jgi:hypothetical protein
VYDVLDYLASGMTETETLADFPDLTSEDIRACLAFAADRERRLIIGGPAGVELLSLGQREAATDRPACVVIVLEWR